MVPYRFSRFNMTALRIMKVQSMIDLQQTIDHTRRSRTIRYLFDLKRSEHITFFMDFVGIEKGEIFMVANLFRRFDNDDLDDVLYAVFFFSLKGKQESCFR